MENVNIEVDSLFSLFILKLEKIDLLKYDSLSYILNLKNFQKAINLNFFNEIVIKDKNNFYDLIKNASKLNSFDYVVKITDFVDQNNTSNYIIYFKKNSSIIKEYISSYLIHWEKGDIITPLNYSNQNKQINHLVKLLFILSEDYNYSNLEYYFMDYDILTFDVFFLFNNKGYITLNNVEKFTDSYITFSINNLFFETFGGTNLLFKDKKIKIKNIFLREKTIFIEKSDDKTFDINITKTESLIIDELYKHKSLYNGDKLSVKGEGISFKNLFKISKCLTENAFRKAISGLKKKMRDNDIKFTLKSEKGIIYFELYLN